MVLADGVEERADNVLKVIQALLGIAVGVTVFIGVVIVLLFCVAHLILLGRKLPHWVNDKFLPGCFVIGLGGLVPAYIYNSGPILAASIIACVVSLGLGILFSG